MGGGAATLATAAATATATAAAAAAAAATNNAWGYCNFATINQDGGAVTMTTPPLGGEQMR
jgi:hypothetical protein